MIDYAIRDRRWAQGNIQHLGLLRVAGLHKMSRLHFLLGAVAYIASLVWLLMLAVSTIAAWCNSWQLNAWQQKSALLPSTTTLPQHLLQPDWSMPDTGMTFSLIVFTTALLMLPKVLGVIATLCLRRQQFGGTKAILRGAIAEALFAILIAPILLSFHATFVISILLGVNVEWDAQDRHSRLLRWKESIQRTFKTTACATVWAFFTFIYTPHFFWWLVPILPGLLLAPAIVRYSSSTKLGQLCRRLSLFLSPSEVDAESILRLVQRQLFSAGDFSLPNSPAKISPKNRTEIKVQDVNARHSDNK
jgi:membrane glycosyltransferase